MKPVTVQRRYTDCQRCAVTLPVISEVTRVPVTRDELRDTWPLSRDSRVTWGAGTGSGAR